MPRQARVVVPYTPHHVTQRGVRRQVVFHHEADYLCYLTLAGPAFASAGLECWAYCLMPNHVHFIVVPQREDSLALAFSALHARYARAINRRERCTGHLWQERFASFPMDEAYAYQCLRYVGLNPVRAGLAARACDWPWSNVRALLEGRADGLANSQPTLERIGPDLAVFFETDVAEEGARALRRATSTGRPLGAAAWVKALERATGATLQARPRGRPMRAAA